MTLIRGGTAGGVAQLSQNHSKVCNSGVIKNEPRNATPNHHNTDKTTGMLNVISIDACDPFEVQWSGGARYFFTFFDDYTSWVAVNPASGRSEPSDLDESGQAK